MMAKDKRRKVGVVTVAYGVFHASVQEKRYNTSHPGLHALVKRQFAKKKNERAVRVSREGDSDMGENRTRKTTSE